MIIKIDRGNNTFTIFENVKNLVYPAQHTYSEIKSQDKDLDDYMNDLFEVNCGSSIHNSPIRVNYVVNLNAANGILANLRFMYFGEQDDSKRLCVKKIRFFSDGEEVCLATQYPVYICNDSGKTIETIK